MQRKARRGKRSSIEVCNLCVGHGAMLVVAASCDDTYTTFDDDHTTFAFPHKFVAHGQSGRVLFGHRLSTLSYCTLQD